MISMNAKDHRIILETEGTVGDQLEEFMCGLHAWYLHTVDRYPEDKYPLRGAIVAIINDDAFWEIKPASKETTYEVDSPEDLFDDLGGD